MYWTLILTYQLFNNLGIWILQMYSGPLTRGSMLETQGDKLNQMKLLRQHHTRSATTGALG